MNTRVLGIGLQSIQHTQSRLILQLAKQSAMLTLRAWESPGAHLGDSRTKSVFCARQASTPPIEGMPGFSQKDQALLPSNSQQLHESLLSSTWLPRCRTGSLVSFFVSPVVLGYPLSSWWHFAKPDSSCRRSNNWAFTIIFATKYIETL